MMKLAVCVCVCECVYEIGDLIVGIHMVNDEASFVCVCVCV